MPKAGVTDAQHVVYTDHSIPRRPRAPGGPLKDAELVAFGGGRATTETWVWRMRSRAKPGRAETAGRGGPGKSPDDVEVLYISPNLPQRQSADRTVLYQRALRLDPSRVTAAVGLGAILFQGR
jgi:hypothetical protein